MNKNRKTIKLTVILIALTVAIASGIYFKPHRQAPITIAECCGRD